jgi:hypothetical protein
MRGFSGWFWPTFQQLKVVVFRVLGWACSRV